MGESVPLRRAVFGRQDERFYYQPDFIRRRGELLANLLGLLLAKSAAVALIWWLVSVELCRLLLEDLKWLPLVHTFGALLFLQAVSGLFLTLLRLKQRAARWTDSAWEACERKAQAAGMSTAAWIRKVTEEAEA